MNAETEKSFIESHGDAKIPDDVVTRGANGFYADDQERRLQEIAELHGDYADIFTSGLSSAEDMAFVLKIAELDVADGTITLEDYERFEKAYEAQEAYENFEKLIGEKDSKVEVRIILNSAVQSHKSGLLTDNQIALLQSRAEARIQMIQYLNATVPEDDGRYGKQI